METKGYEVLGYFVHKDDKELNSYTVLVVVDEGYKKLTCFCPQEGHSEMDRGYFKECRRITKEEYLEASKLFCTPSDYII